MGMGIYLEEEWKYIAEACSLLNQCDLIRKNPESNSSKHINIYSIFLKY